MIDGFHQLLKVVQSGLMRSRLRNALTPFIYACVFFSLPCFYMAHLFEADRLIQYCLIGIGALPVLALSIVGTYLGLTKPGMLQSEEWQTKHLALGVILQKGEPFAINPASIESIANPEAPRQLKPAGKASLKGGEAK